ncbi:mitogen-activated protein kinase kinase kinase 4-like [Sycon ciliatum]|uniref:mitogen-activated protein kinase kinase kinase 4-like n=1 Tax=Sycon ciliatum TaxID=27933 RepID=UPI0031F63C91
MAARGSCPASDSEDEDCAAGPDDDYLTYASPRQNRLVKRDSRKRRSKGENRRQSLPRKRTGGTAGRSSPANVSSGSEDKRSAEKRAALAEGESRTTQRRWDRAVKQSMTTQHSDTFDLELGEGVADSSFPRSLYSSFSELSLSSDGSVTPSMKTPKTDGSRTMATTAPSPVISTAVPRESLHQHVCQVVRGLEMVQSARFYVKQALSIGAESSAEADQKAAKYRLWLELQSALKDREKEHQEGVLRLARAHIDKVMCEIEQFHFNADRSGFSKTSQSTRRIFAKAMASTYNEDSQKKIEVVTGLACFSSKHMTALQSIHSLLSLFDQACTLYPSLSLLLERERADGETDEFVNRHSTLLSWSNASWQLAITLSTLQKWMHVNVSELCLESVEMDDASDIVLSALSNQVTKTSSVLINISEETSDVPGDDLRVERALPISVSAPDPSSHSDTLANATEHDVHRSQSDSKAMQGSSFARKSSDSYTQRYSSFVDAALKRFSLTALLQRLLRMVDDVLQRVHSLFLCPDEQADFHISVPQFAGSSVLSSTSSHNLTSRAVSFASLSPSVVTGATLFSRQQSAMSSVSGASHLPFPSPSSWEEEFSAIGLPSLAEPYLSLLRVPLDVTQQVIRSWLERQPEWKPSAISIRQLIYESKELLVAAHEVKLYYVQLLEAVLPNLTTVYQRQLEVSQVAFEQDLRKVLEAYLRHLHSYVQKIARADHAALDPVNVLEQEWQFISRFVPQVRRGMSNVGRRFCIIAQGFMQNTTNFLESGLDECTTELHNLDRSLDLKSELLQTSRSFRKLFEQVRERSSKAVGFGRMLRKEMQIAADFTRLPVCNEASLLKCLQDTGHSMVHFISSSARPLFVSPSLEDNPERVLSLLNVACGHGGSDHWYTEDYLILLSQTTSPLASMTTSATSSLTSTSTLMDSTPVASGDIPPSIGITIVSSASSNLGSAAQNIPLPSNWSTTAASASAAEPHVWTGSVIEVEPPKETTQALMDLQVDDVKLVVPIAASLPACRSIFFRLCSDLLEVSLEHTSTYPDVGESLAELTQSTIDLGGAIMRAVHGVGRHLMQDGINELEDGIHDDRLIDAYIKTMQRCYGTAFEFLYEVERLVSADQRRMFGIELSHFMTGWMQYVSHFCDMSPHSQPRWMAQGLSFVTLSCREDFLQGLSEDDYQHFSFEVTEFLEKFQFSTKSDDDYDSSPHPEESPWQSMDADTSPSKPRSTLATPILVRHRSKMIARRTNSARVLRWYSSASGSSSPIVHAYDPVERGSSLPVGLPRSAAIDVAGGLEDSMSSADEAHSSATRRKRSISEPVGIASLECRSLSPVIGSPNDAPVEARRILESSAGMAGLATDSAQWSLKRSDDCEESKSLSPRVSLSTGLIATTTPESNGEDADDSGVTATPSPASLDSPACASPFFFSSRIQRCQVSLEKLDEKRSTALLGKRLVGKVMSPSFRPSGKSSIISLKLKQVRFRWQRGNKIGAGKFGQVYSCVNLDTGTTMAVKEVVFQGSSSGAIKDLADEIKMMENINHPHLVHYYGVEMHKEELLIFMEYCSDGTVHDLAKQGPPESLVRVLVHQLLQAVQILHDNCIVHGDIKGANIFLTPTGGVKLGDFGSSVKLADVAGTAHGEVLGMRGTVAFMAPEVIHQNQGRGFGRPADLWSVGCVLVELVTGKHPWSEYDNEFSIMYRVGDGMTPAIPEILSVEGADFLKKCFVADPEDRSSASQLLDHLFVRASESL